MRSVMLPAILLVLSPFGCPDPKPDPTDAELPAQPAEREAGDTGEITSPEQAPAPKPAQAADDAAVLSADPEQSSVGFSVVRAPTGHVGHFERFAAELTLVDGRPSKLTIAVKTASVRADREGLTDHLRSADFFDVAQFPSATFESETIEARPDDGADAFWIAGTMRLHGVRRKLEFPVTIAIEAGRVTGRATLDISAKAFGINYEGMEAELAEDAVSLEIELVFPRVAGP